MNNIFQVGLMFRHNVTKAIVKVEGYSKIDSVLWIQYRKLTDNKQVKNQYMKPVHVMYHNYNVYNG